ncbi:MAG: DUF4114 domain-containing protein [Symploca sp. SIO2B6]|nr:DUF4114 domain-containing protein [Symploca sp. SIO2B6]
MKPQILFTSLAVLLSSVTMIMTTTEAHAYRLGTLSQEAKDLLDISPNSDYYRSEYNKVLDIYEHQASDYSLGFDDWFAMNSFINNESEAYGTNGAKLNTLKALDLDDLTWEADAYGVEVFLINEGAGYWNQFGYALTDGQSMDLYKDYSAPLQIFWDNEVNMIWNGIASTQGIYNNGGSMALGQGFEIGNVAAGNTVNFFLKNGPGNVFDSGTADNTLNQDGLQHVTTYQYNEFLVLAYEDLYGGGDKDYNDVAIAVKGLVDTPPDIVAVPERTSVLGFLGVGLVSLLLKRKHSQ